MSTLCMFYLQVALIYYVDINRRYKYAYEIRMSLNQSFYGSVAEWQNCIFHYISTFVRKSNIVVRLSIFPYVSVPSWIFYNYE